MNIDLLEMKQNKVLDIILFVLRHLIAGIVLGYGCSTS